MFCVLQGKGAEKNDLLLLSIAVTHVFIFSRQYLTVNQQAHPDNTDLLVGARMCCRIQCRVCKQQQAADMRRQLSVIWHGLLHNSSQATSSKHFCVNPLAYL